ncbi:MAG: hypothetical protein PWP11_2616 [Thauera sp.]|nr:hypothetical protein [Thauera sp.]
MVSVFAGPDLGSVGGKGHRNKACGSCRNRLQWDLSPADLGRKCDRPFRPMTYLSPKETADWSRISCPLLALGESPQRLSLLMAGVRLPNRNLPSG